MLLELRNIEKKFGGVAALRRGDLCVDAGEVHLLLGENGAGKSTLMKIVAGMLRRDGGEMCWKGRDVDLRCPADAAGAGIAMVHQESLLAPHLTVAENIFLGRESRLPLGWVNRRKMTAQAASLIEQHSFPLRPEWRVERLSPAGRQLVEICRAIQHGSSLLIFDEPTSSLSEAETQEVFRIVRALRDRKMGVIYITHRLEELRAVGDRVTILRDGETVHTTALQDLSTADIIHHMVGREVTTIYEREPVTPGEELLRVEGLSRKPLYDGVSFNLRAGEIVGLAGLVGAGRTEVCRGLFGIDTADSGKVNVQGREVRIRSPRDAVNAGLALIPEDRQRNGLAALLPLAHNITHAGLRSISPYGFLNLRAEKQSAEKYVQRLHIRAESVKQPAGRLSGGNQQKAVIAKWLFRNARVFLFDEPTRGIDVAAKTEVFQLMDELARSGAAILMVSSEMTELLQVADRILVMRQGGIAGELPGRTTQEQIMRLAALDTEEGTR
ncbi:MAG: sugar ABC transporter ATP-binding protein [Bryobacteraceae bacterium]